MNGRGITKRESVFHSAAVHSLAHFRPVCMAAAGLPDTAALRKNVAARENSDVLQRKGNLFPLCVRLRLSTVVAAPAAPGESVIQSCNFAHGQQRFGLRWQSVAATPLSVLPVASKSGVALRFPPQSKICGCGVSRAGSIRGKKILRVRHSVLGNAFWRNRAFSIYDFGFVVRASLPVFASKATTRQASAATK